MVFSEDVAERLRAHRERMALIRSSELNSIAALGSQHLQLLSKQGKATMKRTAISSAEMDKHIDKIAGIILNGSAPTENYNT